MWADGILLTLSPKEIRAARTVVAPPCPLCGSTVSHPQCLASDRLTVATLCGACGVYFTAGPLLDTKPYAGGFWSNEHRQATRIRTDERTRERAAHLEAAMGRSVRGLTVLEVGAGRGEYALELLNRGAIVIAIEPDPIMARRLTEQLNIVAVAGWVDEFLPDTARYDIVNMSHVLEHLKDPVGTLRRVSRWLKPDGVVALEVPNADVLAHGRVASFFFDEVTHRYHFTAECLGRVARAGGCELFAVEPAFSNHWGRKTALRALGRPIEPSSLELASSHTVRRAFRNPLLQHLAWALWRRPSRALRHRFGKLLKRYLAPDRVEWLKERLPRQ